MVGPNGAGKTSTLRCCSGIIPATRGHIRICGQDIAADPVAAKSNLAFFSDEPRLFEYLTIRQHLRFTGRLYQVADVEERIPRLLEEFDLASKADHLPAELSRGMKQKVAIACGLIHSPSVIFFDEPLTGLDPLAIRRMKDTIRRLAAEGAAIVLSSHLLALLEEVCTHVLILKEGRKIVHGTMAEVRSLAGDSARVGSLEEVFLKIAEDPAAGLPSASASPNPDVPPPLPSGPESGTPR